MGHNFENKISRTAKLDDTVACLLIDHSGSLRGQKAIIACATAQVIADFWTNLGIKYEILGFTTSSWRGGKSRKLWKMALKPKAPGRLCDLLHIIYRSADEEVPGALWAIKNILRDNLLKENIDGEAILWAVDRLKQRKEKKKVICVVSDGVPVDDSSLSVNPGNFLEKHLNLVISQINELPEFKLAAIEIDSQFSNMYENAFQLNSTKELSGKLLKFVGEVILDHKMPD